jgi:SOS-response transcriptional repressor LexA
MITPRQKDMLDVIIDRVDAGQPTTYRALGKAMGARPSACHRLVEQLEARGWIRVHRPPAPSPITIRIARRPAWRANLS